MFFRQDRVGRDGELFTDDQAAHDVPVDAEQRKAELMAQNESDGPLFKIRNDPRITKVGRVLRKLSIDEFPQFWNVVRGEMSIVGPRPALPDEVRGWDDELHDRLRVLPGITGMWQVSGRSDASFDDVQAPRPLLRRQLVADPRSPDRAARPSAWCCCSAAPAEPDLIRPHGHVVPRTTWPCRVCGLVHPAAAALHTSRTGDLAEVASSAMSAASTSVAHRAGWRRLVARRNALGAVAAQFSQAIGSFLLHALAYRFTGTDGLGRFALLYGIIVLATAVMTGLVGDPLTVLDRSDTAVRRGLQRWLVGTAVALSAVFWAGTWAVGTLSPAVALLFGATVGIFVLEDSLRRLLMATLRFGGLVAVDLTSLVVSIGVVLAAHATRDDIGTGTFLAGLLVGQLAACAVGWFVMPHDERWLARGGRADLRAVWGYGSWRALQQMLRPGMMAVVRAAIVAAVGLTTYGTLESAVVYVAPAMLTVAGAASYLFASYARDRTRPLGELVRRADRAVVVLVVLTSLAGLAAVALTGPLGDLLLDEGDTLSGLAVIGWAAYAAASAGVTPYGSLAAVRGQQRTVLAVRAAESIVSVAAVGLLLLADVDIMVIPLVLAVVAAASGVALRIPVLGRMPSDGIDASV